MGKNIRMTSLGSKTPLDTTTGQGPAEKEVALVLSGDGAICTVLHATFDIAPNETIDSLWPRETCERIRVNLRQVLRNRKFFSEEFEQDLGARCAEFTYIAQGRDRVMLVARDNRLTVTGTDMEVELISSVPANVSQDGEITVPARKFLDIVKALPDGANISFSISDDKATLSAGRSRYTLSTLPASEFPATDQVETLENIEGMVIKLINRWNQSDDKMDRKFDSLTKEINDLDNQVSEIKGSLSRVNGKH